MRGLLAVIAVSALVRTVVALGVPIAYDEAHYWVWSRHLMWGYPDHPPITWDADKLGKAIFYHDRQLNERFLTVLT